MRLTDEQRIVIKQSVARIIGADSKVWLFGSRADDTKLGGDIDLLIETPHALSGKATLLCRLEGALVMGLGDRKIDVLLNDRSTSAPPIYRLAKENGVLL